MKIYPSLFIFLFTSFRLFSQDNADCFMHVRTQHYLELELIKKKKIAVGDTLDSGFINSLEKTRESVVGCRYPTSSFTTIENQVLNIDSIKTDFVILNFSHLYDDLASRQLSDLDSISKDLRGRLTIISLYAAEKKELQYLSEKFRNSIEFVGDAAEYIDNYNLGLGSPTAFLLDKKRTVVHVSSGESAKPFALYKELKEFVK